MTFVSSQRRVFACAAVFAVAAHAQDISGAFADLENQLAAAGVDTDALADQASTAVTESALSGVSNGAIANAAANLAESAEAATAAAIEAGTEALTEAATEATTEAATTSTSSSDSTSTSTSTSTTTSSSSTDFTDEWAFWGPTLPFFDAGTAGSEYNIRGPTYTYPGDLADGTMPPVAVQANARTNWDFKNRILGRADYLNLSLDIIFEFSGWQMSSWEQFLPVAEYDIWLCGQPDGTRDDCFVFQPRLTFDQSLSITRQVTWTHYRARNEDQEHSVGQDPPKDYFSESGDYSRITSGSIEGNESASGNASEDWALEEVQWDDTKIRMQIRKRIQGDDLVLDWLQNGRFDLGEMGLYHNFIYLQEYGGTSFPVPYGWTGDTDKGYSEYRSDEIVRQAYEAQAAIEEAARVAAAAAAAQESEVQVVESAEEAENFLIAQIASGVDIQEALNSPELAGVDLKAIEAALSSPELVGVDLGDLDLEALGFTAGCEKRNQFGYCMGAEALMAGLTATALAFSVLFA